MSLVLAKKVKKVGKTTHGSVIAGIPKFPPAGHPNGYPYISARNNVYTQAKHFNGDGGTNMEIN